MCESTLYRNLIELPTDFLTREAFKASVCERDILLPPRFIKYPIKGAGLWGVHGDIEKLPMLTRTVPPSKISGIISDVCDSKHQPCVLTSITIPGKKSEDETDLLPLIKRNIEGARLPECLRPNLFTSHISKFEVFPRFDPVYSQYDAISRRTLKQEIVPATQNALDKLSEVLYRNSIYKTDFQPFGPGKDASLNLPGIGNHETSSQRGPGILTKVSEATGGKEVPTDMGNGRKVQKCGNLGMETEVTEDEDKEEEEEEGREAEKENVLDLDRSSADDQSNESATWKEDAKKARAKWLYQKRNASTVFPTQSSYQNKQGDQAGSSTLTLPHCLQGSTSKMPIQNSSLSSSTKASSFSESLARSKAIQNAALPKKLGGADAVMRLPSVPGGSSYARGMEGMSQDVRLPSLGAFIGDLPQYRNEKLKRKNKLPLMVGMRFKTDAHVKFHKEHPEPVPDLRDSIIDGKKHVFFGANGMLLR